MMACCFKTTSAVLMLQIDALFFIGPPLPLRTCPVMENWRTKTTEINPAFSHLRKMVYEIVAMSGVIVKVCLQTLFAVACSKVCSH